MYRKISLGLVTFNLVLLFVTLGFLVPRFLDLFKDVKVEMPLLMMWLISISNFVSNPWNAVILLLLCFLGVKALDKWAARKS